MAALVRAGLSRAKNAVIYNSIRAVSTTNPLNIKELREHKEGSSIVIEAVNVPSPRADVMVKIDKLPSLVDTNKSVLETIGKPEKQLCTLCALGLDVKHTDVLILSQYVRSDGCMLPRRITGLCKMQQTKIGKMVAMAQKAGLMINMTPGNCKRDPRKRRDWKKFNTYFDERTIFWKRIPKQEDKFKR